MAPIFAGLVAGLLLSTGLADDRDDAAGVPKPAATDAAATDAAAREGAGGEAADPMAEKLRAATRQAQAQLRRALETEINAEFQDEPLDQALEKLAELAGIENLLIKDKDLRDESIGTDEPVSGEFENLPLRLALNRLLKPLNLQWAIVGEALMITTNLAMEQHLVAEVYPVHPRLLREAAAKSAKAYSGAPGMLPGSLGQPGSRPKEPLVEMLQGATIGPWMDREGVGGTLTKSNSRMIIRQQPRTHREIRWLLERLTHIVTGSRTQGLFRFEAPQNQPVRDALTRQISVDYEDRPLREVTEDLSQRLGISFAIDEPALQDEGMGPDEPITLQLSQVTAHTALQAMLEPTGLTVIIEDGQAVVTTRLAAEDRDHMQLVIFVVRDVTQRSFTSKELQETIQNVVRGPWMVVEGTGGTMHRPVPGILVIRQSEQTIHEIAELLSKIRETLPDEDAGTESAQQEGPQQRPTNLQTRFYRNQHVEDSEEPANQVIEQLAETIPQFVEPHSWQSQGGSGTIRGVGNVLIVEQTPVVHAKTMAFLTQLNQASGGQVVVQGPVGRDTEEFGGMLGDSGGGMGGGFFSFSPPQQQ